MGISSKNGTSKQMQIYSKGSKYILTKRSKMVGMG